MNESAARSDASLPRALQDAALTAFSMTVAAVAAAWLDPGPASAVLGAVLALSLARSHLAADRHGWLEALATLPVLGLATLAIGALLHHLPWIGAGVFVAVVSASTWLRRFGALARRIGRLVVLPMAAILVVPPLPPAARWSGGLALLLPVVVALLALGSVALAQAVGRRLGWLAPGASADVAPVEEPAAPGTRRLSAPARLALQMAVALSCAFGAGLLVFPAHWRWLVLTAFLVNIGSLGSLDVVRKSVLRVLGATGGTVLAMGLAGRAGADPAIVGALALACVFAGVFLRVFGYGWWVLCVTLALALLQGLQPAVAPMLLWQRVLEIVLGALIGVAAALLVAPVASTDILRRRLAGALAAMSDLLDPSSSARSPGRLAGPMGLVRQMRPVFRVGRHMNRGAALQPLDWIDALVACEAPVLALAARGHAPGRVRQAIGAARRSMREPTAISAALVALRESLA